MKLYMIYSPPNHRDGVVHHTRAEAEQDNEHFDGKTTACFAIAARMLGSMNLHMLNEYSCKEMIL